MEYAKAMNCTILAMRAGPDVAKLFGDGFGDGVFRVSNKNDLMQMHVMVGSPCAENTVENVMHSTEKPRRLIQLKEHDLSWQSRDPEKNSGGGAVRITTYGGGFLSQAGLPEPVNETFCLAIARCYKLLDESSFYALAQISGNTNLAEDVLEVVYPYS